MPTRIVSQVSLNQLCLHRRINLPMPAAFHLNNERQYVYSRVVWARHIGVHVEISSFPWVSARSVTDLDLAQHNDPPLLEITLEV